MLTTAAALYLQSSCKNRFDSIDLLHECLAVRNRDYTNEVHLRGLTQTISLIVYEGTLCLCSREFIRHGTVILTVKHIPLKIFDFNGGLKPKLIASRSTW